MKILIISDTHIKEPNKLQYISKKLSNVDFILHCGDYIENSVLEYLIQTEKFIGVFGNVDDKMIKNQLVSKKIIEISGYRIGICHGDGKKGSTLERAYQTFAEDGVNIIVYGHSHQPSIQTKNKILMINPGSLTSKRQERWYSYCLLNLNPQKIQAEITFFEIPKING